MGFEAIQRGTMNPEDFLSRAKDPSAWRAKALSLRRSADAVWDEFSRRLVAAIDKDTKSCDDHKLAEATDVLRNCQFLYSLSAECALKGLIVKKNPTAVLFGTTVDGSGSLIDAEIKHIGNIRVDTHNLEKLAETAGILPSGAEPGL
jgi:hypothetical protein